MVGCFGSRSGPVAAVELFLEPSRRRREEDPPPPCRAWRSGGSAANPSPGIGVAAAVVVQGSAPPTRVLDQGLPLPPPVLFQGLVLPPSRPYVRESPRQQLSDHQALIPSSPSPVLRESPRQQLSDHQALIPSSPSPVFCPTSSLPSDLELKTIAEEERILNLDLSAMNQLQKEYYIAKQAAIMAQVLVLLRTEIPRQQKHQGANR
ncbi:hypothetical protein EJB05_23033, partial [Eragrostis curvula]